MDFLRRLQRVVQLNSAVPIIVENPPPQWTPYTVIWGGMFLIQSTPLSSISCIKKYTQWQLDQYVKPHSLCLTIQDPCKRHQTSSITTIYYHVLVASPHMCKQFLTQYLANFTRYALQNSNHVGKTTHSLSSSREMLSCAQLWCNAYETN